MQILADEAVWGVPEIFEHLGEVRTFTGRRLDRPALSGVDALIIRSVTPVNSSLLDGTAVRFVGTASTGSDHVDVNGLRNLGITFATAAGCNARTVAEYVLASLLHLAQSHSIALEEKMIGIVGVGRIGSIVADWCEVLGLRTLLCDPPRSRRGDRTDFIGLDALLAQSDIVTFHVPLLRNGPDATWRLMNERSISACKSGAFLINTSRGDAVDETALQTALAQHKLAGVVLDVWAGEPNPSAAMVRAAELATPHVAGYSVEARQRSAAIIRDELSRFAGRTLTTASAGSAERGESIDIAQGTNDRWGALRQALFAACNLLEMDAALQRVVAGKNVSVEFDGLRQRFASRREFGYFHIAGVPAGESIWKKLGFRQDP